jgi:hypothetical protein
MHVDKSIKQKRAPNFQYRAKGFLFSETAHTVWEGLCTRKRRRPFFSFLALRPCASKYFDGNEINNLRQKDTPRLEAKTARRCIYPLHVHNWVILIKSPYQSIGGKSATGPSAAQLLLEWHEDGVHQISGCKLNWLVTYSSFSRA